MPLTGLTARGTAAPAEPARRGPGLACCPRSYMRPSLNCASASPCSALTRRSAKRLASLALSSASNLAATASSCLRESRERGEDHYHSSDRGNKRFHGRQSITSRRARRCTIEGLLAASFLDSLRRARAVREGLLGSFVLVRKDGARSLGEECFLFGRKLDSSADPTADIPGGDLGDAHRVTPKCDGNAAGTLNRLLALPDGYRWRGRRNEGALGLGNDGARLRGEVFLAGARKLNLSVDPALPLGSECSGDAHRLPTNHQREAAAGDLNRPSARADRYFRFHRSFRGVTCAACCCCAAKSCARCCDRQ